MKTCKEKRLEKYETLAEYISEYGKPWTVGATRGAIDASTELIILARHYFDRLALPIDVAEYSVQVEGMFTYVARTEYWNIKTTYAQRDAVLGNSANRVTTRTGYAAPDGSPDIAYSTGMEEVTDTAPMHENVDRALAVQENWKDAETEMAAAFDRCFLGVIG